MTEYHLSSLQHALIQKGWKIVSTREIENYPYDCHVWKISRGPANLEIHFDRFGDMGEDVPLTQSSGCLIGGIRNVRLSFSKPSKWKADLKIFLDEVDHLAS